MIFDKEPFIFIEPPESLPGAGFILSTKPPFYIGRVIKLDVRDYKEGEYVNCDGYSVVILPTGSLVKGHSEDIRIVLAQMANYYLEFKIKKYESRFKRYRI